MKIFGILAILALAGVVSASIYEWFDSPYLEFRGTAYANAPLSKQNYKISYWINTAGTYQELTSLYLRPLWEPGPMTDGWLDLTSCTAGYTIWGYTRFDCNNETFSGFVPGEYFMKASVFYMNCPFPELTPLNPGVCGDTHTYESSVWLNYLP